MCLEPIWMAAIKLSLTVDLQIINQENQESVSGKQYNILNLQHIYILIYRQCLSYRHVQRMVNNFFVRYLTEKYGNKS